MLSEFCQRLLVRSTGLAERYFSGKHAALKITLLWFFSAAFIAYPDWDLVIRAAFLPGRGPLVWAAILQQSAHPFAAMHYPASAHEAKMALRLVPPLIGHVLGFGIVGFFLFQVTSYLLFCYISVRLILRISGDVACTCFAALICAASGLGSILALDTSPLFDAVAFAFMAMAMLSSSPVVIVAGLVLAGFSDERGLVAFPLIFLFHLLRGGAFLPLTLGQIVRANAAAWSAALAVPVYIGLRVVIEQATGLHTPHDENELRYFLGNFDEWAISLWSAFEAGWIVILASMAVLYLHKARLALLLFALAIIPTTVAGFMVIDMTRSLCFLFPIFLLAVGILCTHEPRPRGLLFFVMLASLLFPNYDISGSQRPRFMVPALIAPIQWIPILLRHR